MKDVVVIKSFPNGISIFFDEDTEFEALLEAVGQKFAQSRTFFGHAKVALSLEGRIFSHAEEMQILELIRTHSDVEIICIVGKNDENNKFFLRALQEVEKRISNNDEGQFYRGTLRDRAVLETEASVVLLGDVYPGCAVISAKNVIILGGLYGEVYAGGNGEEGHFIVALEMEPERLTIGDFKYRRGSKQSKWGIRPKVQPKVAYVKDKRIVFEPLTKDLLEGF
ncbi:MAG: septum site-determining protein MinC [Lachnospiraceae bacterium]|nr:septum site-determining protein MinC [Lachnospiraceae bacterium]